MAKTAMQRELERLTGEDWGDHEIGSGGDEQNSESARYLAIHAVEDLLDAIYRDATDEDTGEGWRQSLYEALDTASKDAKRLLDKAPRRRRMRLNEEGNSLHHMPF